MNNEESYLKWKLGKWRKDENLHYLLLGHVIMAIIWHYIGSEWAVLYIFIYLIMLIYRYDYYMWKNSRGKVRYERSSE